MQTTHRNQVLAIVALLAAVFAAGCGQKDDVLAVVGDRTITSSEFIEVVRGNERSYPVDPDSARSMAFDDILRRELLLAEALRRGMAELPDAKAFREDTERRVLVQQLYESEAPQDLPVSDAEIRTMYQWRDSTANVQLIYATDKSTIDGAVAALERGEPFEEVANRYNVPGTIPPGGNLGWRVSGDLVDPLDEKLRTAPVGKVAGPLEAPTEGWFLLNVLERKLSEQPPLEEQRPGLEMMIRQRKQRELATQFYTGLRDDYEVTLSNGGAQDVFTFYNRRLQADATGTPQEEPSEEALARVLATYRGADGTTQPYTFADARNDLRDARGQGPDLTMLPAIQRWIESQVVRRAALIEARARDLQDDPRVSRLIEREVDTHLVDGIFAEEVTQQVQLGPEDLMAAYERRKDVIQQPFDELTQAELRGLQNDAAAFKSDEIFRSLTDHLKDNIKPYIVHEDRLARIPWPVPETPAP